MSLYKFTNPDIIQDTKVSGGADILIPTGSGHINVVKDYAWTIQPETARKDVPYIFLIERKLTNDVMVQQLLYNLIATVELGYQGVTEAQQKIEKELNKAKGEYNLTDDQINKIKSSENFNSKNPYAGLYNLEDTGWSYIMPFFENNNHNVVGSWGQPKKSNNVVDKIGGAVNEGLGDVSASFNKAISALGSLTGASSLARPGTYIEQAKQYLFEAQGPSYSVKFNLFNTGKLSDVIQNWELCFALIYNLLPNRRTKTVFDPPPLYEVSVPGVRNSPISFIKGMKIDFLGATRLMDLDVQGINNTPNKIRTIVPDAYSVKIDIEDILPESKNFMQSIYDDQMKVRVSTKQETVSRTYENNIISNANEITHITLGKKNSVNTQKTPAEQYANDDISESVRNTYRSDQRTTKNTTNIPRGRF